MRIKTLRLKNFRNYAEAEVRFADGITVLSGANAQGKTNCAEAIFFLCTGYSPRITREKQLVKIGEESGFCEGEAESLYGAVKVRIDLSATTRRRSRSTGCPSRGSASCSATFTRSFSTREN